MANEAQAIAWNPPGSSSTTVGCVDVRFQALALTLVAATASAATKVLTTADSAPTGCFVTFQNPGTTTISICFGNASLPNASAVAADFELLPGTTQSWWCGPETHFSALCASGNTLKRYRSSN